jgi:hypothetical protein
MEACKEEKVRDKEEAGDKLKEQRLTQDKKRRSLLAEKYTRIRVILELR